MRACVHVHISAGAAGACADHPHRAAAGVRKALEGLGAGGTAEYSRVLPSTTNSCGTLLRRLFEALCRMRCRRSSLCTHTHSRTSAHARAHRRTMHVHTSSPDHPNAVGSSRSHVPPCCSLRVLSGFIQGTQGSHSTGTGTRRPPSRSSGGGGGGAAQVRSSAAFKVAGVAAHMTPDITLRQLLPCIRELVQV